MYNTIVHTLLSFAFYHFNSVIFIFHFFSFGRLLVSRSIRFISTLHYFIVESKTDPYCTSSKDFFAKFLELGFSELEICDFGCLFSDLEF
jgi:hypothetical protein